VPTQDGETRMNTLIILNDPPYGSERSYNGLRLASALAKRESEVVRVFLMGDAAACAKGGQKVPQGCPILRHSSGRGAPPGTPPSIPEGPGRGIGRVTRARAYTARKCGWESPAPEDKNSNVREMSSRPGLCGVAGCAGSCPQRVREGAGRW